MKLYITDITLDIYDKILSCKDDLIELYITCYGGEVNVLIPLYELIKHSSIPVHTYCIGICESAAAILFLAGHKRYITRNGKIMMHQLQILKIGQRGMDGLNYETYVSNYLNNIIQDIHMAELGKPFIADTYIDAEYLVSHNLAVYK